MCVLKLEDNEFLIIGEAHGSFIYFIVKVMFAFSGQYMLSVAKKDSNNGLVGEPFTFVSVTVL